MFTLNINYSQVSLLLDVIEAELSTLSTEIGKTDDADFKASLKTRRQNLDEMAVSLKKQIRSETDILMT